MAVFHGTDAGEVIIGGNDDDVFHSSRGQDILDGGGGYDKAIIDYSAGGAGDFRGHSISYQYDGLYGRFFGFNGDSVETVRIEEIEFRASAASDQFSVNLTQVPALWRLSLDGGGGTGFDVVTVRLHPLAAALVGTVTGGTLSSGNLTLSNFEQFDLYLGNGNDDVTLGAGNDTISAGNGNDIVNGGAGNDLLEGEWGADQLNGGDGDDALYAEDDYTALDGGTDIDILSGGAGNDLLSIGYGDSADGGTGSDRLSISLRRGTAGAVLDLSAMFAGATINVGGGTIAGFESYDTIYGTDFADTITTGDAANAGTFLMTGIFGYAGDDTITTGIRADTVGGGEGNDTLRTGGDNDRVSGETGNDRIFGDAGADTIFGGEGDDELHGGDHNDDIQGDWGADQLFGDGGDDRLTGGVGADMMAGGAGNDVYYLEGGDAIVEAVGGGFDTVHASSSFAFMEANYSLPAGAEIELFTAGMNSHLVDVNLTGNEFGQQLIGNGRANILDGKGGADTLTGLGGNDIYHVDHVGDVVQEAAGEGTDLAYASASYALTPGQHVETLAAISPAATDAIDLTGNELANTIIGNAGANALSGAAGNDVLNGGGGADRLHGGDGRDRLSGGEGADVFAFTLLTDSQTALRSDGKKQLPDVIVAAFVSGEDRIDLSAIDAIAGTAANDAFTFIGTGAFTGQAGEVRYDVRVGQALISVDVDGNRAADLHIVAATPVLLATDFIL